ncbi:FadR family transcriptional regulator [Actinobacteria bacterium YIM 96077]|nr:FadR/GntR family transcriptional regulator [Phytoactinopolyspora halophila]AYY13161.1 FadR family transcriptional regulator [Actinobacteria bacterium YIM 96077]
MSPANIEHHGLSTIYEPASGIAASFRPVGTNLNSGGLYGSVVQTLGRRIATGELPAGTRLRVEDLSVEFGVSRTIVRESLRSLEAKRLVGARPRVGTLVLPVDQWNLLDPDVIGWRLGGPSADALMTELLDLRRAVEPLAARSFANHPDDEGLRALRESAEQMRRAVDDGDFGLFSQADSRFHRIVVAHSGSQVLGQLVDAVVAALQAREQLLLMPEHLDEAVVRSHAAVVECIANQDPDDAEHAARLIVDVASDEVARKLKEGTP